ncbi:unnamed protein product (macronuclear) [Paramecium tetraurelia]|uniref:Uncharacterized protein n=1 Tax=Paramecium tetraurelia TaxID=5888 RepID=A0D6L1_PARTE|nr:uncharacterized protein GSPATT00001719001 [Paramecium tetraurelia]CAK78678.1 unnamed protein product [Paramecium tetraurelia]|eukprot:XP_001446075.1 hypothetical protein (macronuclear) [Paramecium tetraurelia strain d4-2]
MRVAVNPSQVSRSLPPAPMPVMKTPVMVDRVASLHHTSTFNKESPINTPNEQQLIELETRILNLEQDSSIKLKCENLIQENKKLTQQVSLQTESVAKFKGELSLARKEISKQNFKLLSRLKKVLDIKEEALTDIRIKNHTRNLSQSDKLKNDKLIQQKEIMEQQYLKEKQQLQNQIQQLEELLEQQCSLNQNNQPSLYLEAKQPIIPNQQIDYSQPCQQTSQYNNVKQNEQYSTSQNRKPQTSNQEGGVNSIFYRPNHQDKLYQVPSKGLSQESSSPKFNNQSFPCLKFNSIPQESIDFNSQFDLKNKSIDPKDSFKAHNQLKDHNMIQRKSLSSITELIQQNGQNQSKENHSRYFEKNSTQSPNYQFSNTSQLLQELEQLKNEVNSQKDTIQESHKKISQLEYEKSTVIEKNEKLLREFRNQVEEIKQLEHNKNNIQNDILQLEEDLQSQKIHYESCIQDQQHKYNLLEQQFYENKRLLQEKLKESTKSEQDNQCQQFKKQLEEKQLEIINISQKVLNYKNKNDQQEIQINQMKKQELDLNQEFEKVNKQYQQIKRQFDDTVKNLNEAQNQIQIMQSQYLSEYQLREKIELNYAILQKEFSQYKENSVLQIEDLQSCEKFRSNSKNIEYIQNQQDLQAKQKVMLENSNGFQQLDQDITKQLQKANNTINEQNKQIIQLQQTNQKLEDEIGDVKNKFSKQTLILTKLKSDQNYKCDKCKSLKLDLSGILMDEQQIQDMYYQQQQLDQVILENDSIPIIYDQVNTERNQLLQKLQQNHQDLVIQKQQNDELVQIHQDQNNQICILKSQLLQLEIITQKQKEQINQYENEFKKVLKDDNILFQQKQIDLRDYNEPTTTKGYNNLTQLINQQVRQREQDNKYFKKPNNLSAYEIQTGKDDVSLLQKKVQQQNEIIKQLNQQLDNINFQYQNLLIEQQSNNLQIELQKSEYEQMKKHLQTTISKQKIFLEEKEIEIQNIKQQKVSLNDMNQIEIDKINQLLTMSQEKIENQKKELYKDMQKNQAIQQANTQLRSQLERVQSENADLHEIIIELQKENVNLRDNNQKLTSKFDDNIQTKEQNMNNMVLRRQSITISQQCENFCSEQPKPGFITSKNNRKLDEIERENLTSQKEISKLKQMIGDLSNNQNYNPERKLSNSSQHLSQKKHLFDQNSIKCKHN